MSPKPAHCLPYHSSFCPSLVLNSLPLPPIPWVTGCRSYIQFFNILIKGSEQLQPFRPLLGSGSSCGRLVLTRLSLPLF